VTDAALPELRQLRATVAELVEVQHDLQRRLLDREERCAGIVLLPASVIKLTFTSAAGGGLSVSYARSS